MVGSLMPLGVVYLTILASAHHMQRRRSHFQGGGPVFHILLSPVMEISAQI